MKKQYSQNGEDFLINDYFQGAVGTLLSIGENDGKTLSNVYGLIEQGWGAYLVEPSPSAFSKLETLHAKNDLVRCFPFAISHYDGEAAFHDSGSHLNVGDTALLSTLNQADYDKWRPSTEFKTITVPVKSVSTFLDEIAMPVLDLISIDAEGEDLNILRQLPLVLLQTKLVVIEWNSNHHEGAEMDKIFNGLGFSLLHRNQENLLYAKNY